LLRILWVDFLQSENHERNQSDKRSFERDLKKLTKSSLNEFQQIWYGGDIKKRFSNVVWEKVEYTFRVKFKVQSNQSVIPLTDKSSSSSTIKRRYLEKSTINRFPPSRLFKQNKKLQSRMLHTCLAGKTSGIKT